MTVGFYSGSFDPFTNGHLHVVKSSAKILDKVIIGIGVNSQKPRRYDLDLMKNAIEKVLLNEGLSNVSVVAYENLSIDVAIQNNATVFIRGIRNGMDYDYEENLAAINEELCGLNTIFIRAGTLGAISSSMVMELVKNNKDVSKFLPKEILEAIYSI